MGVPGQVGTKARLHDFEVLSCVFFLRYVAFKELKHEPARDEWSGTAGPRETRLDIGFDGD